VSVWGNGYRVGWSDCAKQAFDARKAPAVSGWMKTVAVRRIVIETNAGGWHQSGMRYVVAVGVVLFLAVGLGGIKFSQISMLIAFGEAAAKQGPPPESVATAKAEAQIWESAVSAVGSVAAVQGVQLSSEVPGVVRAVRFESGQLVRAGQPLLVLDSSVERAQLSSAAAQLGLAKKIAERSRRLFAGDALTQAQLDADEAQLEALNADVGALQAQIARKTLRAPFAGRLGIRRVNLGQYLNPGEAIAVLESQGSVFVDFSVPQDQLSQVAVGTPVRATVTGQGTGSGGLDQASLTGQVAALDPTVDESTRTATARAEIANPNNVLRPGMFVSVQAVNESKVSVVAVPATAVVHQPYGDSVFVVEKSSESQAPDAPPLFARQQFVQTGRAQGDFVEIRKGLSEGREVVTAGAFKLRNGAPVVVNNSVKLDPQRNPSPENR